MRSGALPGVRGERLSLDDYRRDFRRGLWEVGAAEFWKIERTQVFVERGSASYDAFARGEWERALELIREDLPRQREYHDRVAARGTRRRRVRVVEQPLAPYVLWELNLLRQRSGLGEPVRVLEADRIADRERRERLPDVVGFDDRVAYQVLYTGDGVPVGAIRSTEREQVLGWRGVFEELYAAAEPLVDYFDRRLAGLRP
ncbi:DUF6879 family protein [Saccharothrix coeruleofusca]|uniref:DUF6879 domain-containing protein n=1 Tax=Saccharothrix coeruleofusca TaxID=33919 RepID=A0A918AS82_9PSEU|nr:DUF6879 family protein [Saccharothrix coeruleofusca]MBP2338995.1 hypothetical protein [Saccharothrix coeruleofusca]GGP69398.1 hypothetical protein GCM10010185_47740 [Saccharothrix coeruleofusca]